MMKTWDEREEVTKNRDSCARVIADQLLAGATPDPYLVVAYGKYKAQAEADLAELVAKIAAEADINRALADAADEL